MLWKSIACLLVVGTAIAADGQACVGPDGKVVDGFLPCTTSATSGTCCDQGEACLESGLCYGSMGLVYRGACINKWDPAGCPTYCEDSGGWANFYPCAYSGSGSKWGPASWWCGPQNTTMCEVNTGTFMHLKPGIATMILPLATISTTAPAYNTPKTSQTIATSATSLPTSPAAVETTPPSKNSGSSQAALIGLGAGFGALAFICVIGGFWIMRRNRQRQIDHTIGKEAESLSPQCNDQRGWASMAPSMALQEVPAHQEPKPSHFPQELEVSPHEMGGSRE